MKAFFYRASSKNFLKNFLRSAKLCLFALPLLFSVAFAYPVNKSNGQTTIYQGSTVNFLVSTSDLGFTPAGITWWSDYYSTSPRYGDIVGGYVYIDGVQYGTSSIYFPGFGLPVTYNTTGAKIPYFCFHTQGLNQPGDTQSCFTYNSNNGDLPTNSYINVISYSAGNPDLKVNVKNMVDGSLFEPGENFRYVIEVQNDGGVELGTTPRIQFYWKKDNRSYTPEYKFGFLELPNLSAGQKKQYLLTFHVPDNIPGGKYYLYYALDSLAEVTESYENNNRYYEEITVLDTDPVYAELFNDSSLTQLSTTTVQPGQTLRYYPYFRNTGDIDANSFRIQFYWQKDTRSYQDQYKFGYATVPGIVKQGVYTKEYVFNIPEHTPPGTYYLYYVIDSLNQVDENNENNNRYYATITVEDDTANNKPDYINDTGQSAISSQNLNPGDTFYYEPYFLNVGNADATRDASVYFYFGKDRIYDYDYLFATSTIPSLNRAQAHNPTLNFTVPQYTPPGTYYLYYEIDSFDQIAEENENNNRYYIELTINSDNQTSLPDLLVNESSSPIDTTVFFPGKIFRYYPTFVNAGETALTRSFRVSFYLEPSSNGQSFHSDFYLGKADVIPLVAGQTKQYTLTFKVPEDYSPGNYNFYYKIDSLDQISEEDENNNHYSISLVIDDLSGVQGCTDPDALNYDSSAEVDDGSCVLPGKNLFASFPAFDLNIFESEPPNYNQGDTFSFFVDIFNDGTVDTEPTTINFYVNHSDVSASQRYSSNLINTESVPALVAGDTSFSSFSYTVPGNFLPGTYIISWSLDPNNLISETNESDNKDFAIFTVGDPDGNVVISGCTDPYASNYNQSANDDDGTCFYDDDSGDNYYSEPPADDVSFTDYENEWWGDYFQGDLQDDIDQNYNLDVEDYFADASSESCTLKIGVADTTVLSDIKFVTHVSSLSKILPLSSPVSSTGNFQMCKDGFCSANFTANLTGYVESGLYARKTSNIVAFNPSAYGWSHGTIDYTYTTGSCTYTGSFEYVPSSYFVPGCTSVNAENYNGSATVDDGSCRYPKEGCLDPDALNYDPTATIASNEACTYTPSADSSFGFSIADGYVIPVGKSFKVNYWFNIDEIDFTPEEARFYKDYRLQTYISQKLYEDDLLDQRGLEIYDTYVSRGEFTPRLCLISSTESRTLCVFVDGEQNSLYAQHVTVVEDSGKEGCLNPLAQNYDPLVTISDGSCIFSGSSSTRFFGRKFQTVFDTDHLEVDFSTERIEGKWVQSLDFPSFGPTPNLDYDAYLCYTKINEELDIEVPEVCVKLDSFAYTEVSGQLELPLPSNFQAEANACTDQQVFRSFYVRHVSNPNDRVEMNFYNSWESDTPQQLPSSLCSQNSDISIYIDPDDENASSLGIFGLKDINFDLPDSTPAFFQFLVKGYSVEIPYVNFTFSIPGVESFLRGLFWFGSFTFKLFEQIPFVGDVYNLMAPVPSAQLNFPQVFFGVELDKPSYNSVQYARFGDDFSDFFENLIWFVLTLYFLSLLFSYFFKT